MIYVYGIQIKVSRLKNLRLFCPVNSNKDDYNKRLALIDIASVAYAIKEFSVSQEEDVCLWLTEVKMVGRIVGSDEKKLTQLTLFKLR